MAQLRIPSHMSGEQYITKAALIADPLATTSVTVYPGTELILRDYRKEATEKGYTLIELYNRRHNKTFTTEIQVEGEVHRVQTLNAQKMADFLRAGIRSPERVVLSKDKALTPQTSGSTATVADFYARQPAQAEAAIKEGLLNDPLLTPRLREQIKAYYSQAGFVMGGKYALFWGRKSGEATGAGPWLDTNEVMLAQMMIVVRRRDPGRKLVLIGDPVHLPSQVDGMPVPMPDINLIQYWDHAFPGGETFLHSSILFG